MGTELKFNVDANVLKKNRTKHYAGTLQQWLTGVENSLQEKVNKDPTTKHYATQFPDEYFVFKDDIKKLLKDKGFNVTIENTYEDGSTFQLTW